jgi:hypothetical protein
MRKILPRSEPCSFLHGNCQERSEKGGKELNSVSLLLIHPQKHRSKLVLLVGENPLHVAVDEEAIDQRAAGNGIKDVVTNRLAAIAFGEAALVTPESVWAMTLLIHEAVWRIPPRNRALPPQPVINRRAFVHLDGVGI